MNKQYCFLLLFILSTLQSAWGQNDLLLNWANALNNTQSEGGFINGRSIKVDVQGNTYVVGTFNGTADFDPSAGVMNLVSAGNKDVFLAKYDASGNYIYAKGIGGLGEDIGCSLAIDNIGNTYVTGSFLGLADFDPSAGVANLTAAGGSDVFFAKYDASGNYIYGKRIGGPNNDISNGIAVDGSGYAYVTGRFSGTADFDPSAAVVNLISFGGYDIFLAKYDASGNYVYAKGMGGISNDIGYSVTVDTAANAYITGQFGGVADFNPSPTVANLTSFGGNDIFLAKYDALGNYVYAKGMGGTSEDIGNSVTVDTGGNAYITGQFFGAADFDPSVGVVNLSNAGNYDIFLAKYDASGNYVYAKGIGGTIDDIGNSVSVDNSGNAYVTGFFSRTVDFDPSAGIANLTSAGSSDVFLAKYDASGNYVYAKALGGTGYDNGVNITVDGSGNTYVIGTFSGTVDFDPSSGTANLVTASGLKNCFIGKYNSTGNYVWAKALSSNFALAYNAEGVRVTCDALGNIYVLGNFEGTVDFDPSPGVANLVSVFGNDIFLAKYDSSGNYVFAKRIGGSNNDYGNGIALDDNGNIYLTGHFKEFADFDPSTGVANLSSVGADDIFLAKYDASGNYVYAKRIGGTGSDYPTTLAIDGNNDVILVGSFNGTVDFDPSAGVANLISAGYEDVFLAKYNALGNYVYAKRIGNNNVDYVRALAIDNNNDVIITGQFTETVDFDPSVGEANLIGIRECFIAKYDVGGNYVYAKAIGGGYGDAFGNDLVLDSGGNVYVTGWFHGTADFDPSASVAHLVNTGSDDIFLAKYDTSGNYVYAKAIDGYRYISSGCIAIDNNGNIFLTGIFEETADLDPSAGVASPTGLGVYNIFLAKYDSSGRYLDAHSFTGPSSVTGSYLDGFGPSVTVDDNGNTYITGQLYGTSDFDPSVGTHYLSSVNNSGIFVARYSQTSGTAGVNDFFLNNLKLYPNPVTDILNIESEQTISDVEVYSIMGQRVMVKAVNAMSASIDMSALTGGTYLVKVVVDDAVKTIKVIKK